MIPADICKSQAKNSPQGGGKDGKPDIWFLFDLYTRKRNPETEMQEPVPEMSHVSQKTNQILQGNA